MTTPVLIDGPIDEQALSLPAGALATSVVLFAMQANAMAVNRLTFSVYGTVEEARAAFEIAPQVLLRAGWQLRETTGIDHNATCLTLQTGDLSQAICYVSRDGVIITAYADLPIPAIDAVYLNANDLALFGSDIYDQVERP